jgi:2-polyprenyl-3-methyl-5-hydroxy-6-metoxy-1,4-benzoquinol methylase
MSNVFHKNCPVCSSENIQPFFEGKDYSHTGESFDVVKCAGCDFTFTQNIPDLENIGPYYESEKYVSHSDTQKGLFFKVYHTVRSYMLGQKRKMVTNAAPKGKLLDIGCGTGYFLNEMNNHGWDCQGIEQDEKARKYGAEKFNLTVNKPAHLNSLPDSSYNSITMWHVLEHVHDLNGYLTKIKAALKPNGSLVVAVPNYDSHDAKRYGKHWAAWDLPIHLWHFTPATMSKLMEKHQLKIVKHHRLPFDSFYVSLLSEKYKGGNAIMGFITGKISFLKSLLNVKKCSSVVYIIKKA